MIEHLSRDIRPLGVTGISKGFWKMIGRINVFITWPDVQTEEMKCK